MNKFYDRFFGVSHLKTKEDGVWYVVGDIHGQYDLLMEQLAEVDFDFDKDKLFALGDLIDRGPKSWECLQLVYEPWFYSIKANHEQIMYDALTTLENHGPYGVMSDANLLMWTRNGGMWWFDQDYVDHPTFAEEAVGIVEDLPNFRTIIIGHKTIGLIHASGTRQWPPQKSKINTFGEETIWCRKFLNGTVPKCHGVDLVVVGHNPTDKPTKQNNTLHIDTGYKTGRLSILNLEELV